MAEHLRCPRHRRSRIDELPCRPQSGYAFLSELTSFGVGYFTINAYMNDGIYNQALLDSMPAVEETKFLRWVRFERPLTVKMDGKKKIGVVMFNE